MTLVKASFVDGVRVPIGGGTITYTPVGLRATVADPAKTVAPIDIVAEITAGVAQDKDLEPGPYSVRIEVEWFLEMYSIVVPATGPVQLIELIDDSTPYEPPVVSLVKQYRDEAAASKAAAAGSAATADTSAAAASGSKTAAAGSATAAAGSASAAATSAIAAAASADTASTKASGAETARAAAVVAKTAAETARTDADAAASVAGSKASEAGGHETAAAGSAGSAAGSAATATSAATAAGAHAGQAASAASAAAQSAVEAANAVTGVASVGGLTGAVTKAQLDIDKVDNTRDADKEVSGPTQQALNNLLEAVDSAFTGLSGRVDEKTTVAQAQAIATAAVAAVIDNSPAALDTLAELAAALGNDPNFATTVMNLIGQKAASTDPRFTDARSPLGTTQAVWNAGTANSANFGLTPAELRAAIVVAIGVTAPKAHTHDAEDVDGLITEFSNVQAQLMNKVNSYPGQTIFNWAGTQAAYDALPAATKTAAGFIAAIY